MKKNHNYIVVHRWHGRCISRWYFGDDEARAINHANEVVAESYQNGTHTVLVVDEVTNDVVFSECYEVADANLPRVGVTV